MTRRLGFLFAALIGILALPTSALAAAETNFQPVQEFINDYWTSVTLGPLEMGISKLVVYLWLGMLVSVVLTLWSVRGGLRTQPGRTQTVVELL